MHRKLIEEGFNRRYVLVPMLLAIGLVAMGFWVGETRRAHARELSDVVRKRQDVIRVLTETMYRVLEAESAQRGYLLTSDERYLAPLEDALSGANARLDELQAQYATLAPEELGKLESLQDNLAVKAGEMRDSAALHRARDRAGAMRLVQSDLGLLQMRVVSDALAQLRDREVERFASGIREWTNATRLNTVINLAATLFTIVILLVLGLLASRDIRRRETFATQLAAEIDARTTELQDLSQHMSRVAEAEKHALARELHDELGGLLVAMRIDLVQLRKRIGPGTDPELQARWDRVEQALAQGLELKRRVIEDLRPTLLDNMGLFTALRWLATQRAEQARLKLQLEGLDEDVEIPPETAIAVFRTVQEAIANIINHARATQFSIRAQMDSQLTLEIADDGQGVPEGAERRTGSHGLRQMRFRMEAVGGTLSLSPRLPRGTIVVLSVAVPPPAPAAG